VSLWFRRSYERVLQRGTHVGTGTLVRATPAGIVPRCRIGGCHEDHGPLGRSTLHARRGNPLGRYQLLAAEVGIRAVLLKRRLDEALRLMLATSKEERSLTGHRQVLWPWRHEAVSRAFRARFGMPPRHR
jgi:hypothetical protein